MDTKDKKILIELLKDARVPISKIAKVKGLTRQIVRYRLPKLVEEGIIKAFVARIHQPVFCQGVANFRAKLVRFDKVRMDEVIARFIEHPLVNWVTELSGSADIMCTIMYKDLEQLSATVSELTQTLKNNLQDHSLSLYINEFKFDRSGLIEQKPARRAKVVEFSKPVQTELDRFDLQILSLLAKDCRISIADIARRVRMNHDTVRLRIKSMEKEGTIKGYTIVLDPSKLGFEGYQVSLHMESMTQQTLARIQAYVSYNPYITFCARTSGSYNIMLAIEAKSRNHFKEILQELRTEFAGILRGYDMQLSVNEYKEVFVPEGFFKSH